MSDLFGHHHQPAGRPTHHEAGGEHQRHISGPAPAPPQLSFTVQPAVLASEPLRRRRRPDTNLSWTIGAFLVPDDDPWRRERWRRLGEKPDPGDA